MAKTVVIGDAEQKRLSCGGALGFDRDTSNSRFKRSKHICCGEETARIEVGGEGVSPRGMKSGIRKQIRCLTCVKHRRSSRFPRRHNPRVDCEKHETTEDMVKNYIVKSELSPADCFHLLFSLYSLLSFLCCICLSHRQPSEPS